MQLILDGRRPDRVGGSRKTKQSQTFILRVQDHPEDVLWPHFHSLDGTFTSKTIRKEVITWTLWVSSRIVTYIYHRLPHL